MLRRLSRLVALASWTTAVCIAWALGSGLTFWSPGLRRAWRRRVFRWWATGALRALAVRVIRRGEPPAGLPHLLVANHLSYLDVIVLAAQKKGTVFVAKSEVGRWPVWGPLARAVGTVFIDREKARDALRVAEEMAAAWDRGDGLVIFPEATSTPGDRVEPFRTALLEPAAAAGWPVQCVALWYGTAPADPPAAEAVAWWGDMEFGPHLWNLVGLRSVEARVIFGAEPINARDRKELGVKLHAAVDDLRREIQDGK